MTDTRDHLTLTGLRVRAHHGVFDFERENGQDFFIDVTVYFDAADAATSDDIGNTVHYGELAVEIAEAVKRDPVDLIETLAERVADTVLAHSRVASVRVTVNKPDAPITVPFENVSITITRPRQPRGAAA